MNAQLHTPERLAGETMDQYRGRRKASKDAAQKSTLTGCHTPDKGTSRAEYRQLLRKNGRMREIAGAYGRGLRNWIARTQAAAQANKRAARMDRAIS